MILDSRRKLRDKWNGVDVAGMKFKFKTVNDGKEVVEVK